MTTTNHFLNLPVNRRTSYWTGCLLLVLQTSFAQRFVGVSSQVQQQQQQQSSNLANLVNYKATGAVRWQAALLADGDFSKSLSATDARAPKTGSLGASFIRFKTWEQTDDATKTVTVPHFQGNFIVSLGSQGDTLRAGLVPFGSNRISNQAAFGQALLIPGSNARAARALTATLLWFPFLLSPKSIKKGLGVNAFLNVTQTRWGDQQTTEDVRLVSLSAGAYYTVFNLPASGDADNSLKLDLYLDLTMRNIGGDIREEKQILDRALGNRKYTYYGLEPGFAFTVNSLRLAANFPLFPGSIKGFSNGQFVANLGFSTALNLTK